MCCHALSHVFFVLSPSCNFFFCFSFCFFNRDGGEGASSSSGGPDPNAELKGLIEVVTSKLQALVGADPGADKARCALPGPLLAWGGGWGGGFLGS